MRGIPTSPIPDLRECIEANERSGRLTNPDCRCIGVSINTAALGESDARAMLERTSAELGLPATDSFRFGTANLVDAL